MERYRLYDGFAPFYDLYWGDYFLEDAREGIADTLLPRIPVGGRVLDLCCGTGQTAAWLATCGFEVVGLDGSEPMLRFAARNAPTAELICADARGFRLSEPVDAALATFDSINHFESLDEVQAVFSSVFEALRPGGWFLFDFNEEEGFAYNAGETYSVCRADHVAIVKSEYDAASGRGCSRITLFEPASEGLWSRRDLDIPEFLHATEDLEQALGRAGFASLRTFDATDDFGMEKAEGRYFLLAQKPKSDDA